MRNNDLMFISQVTDAIKREKAIVEWKNQRTWFFVAGCFFLVAAIVFVVINQPGPCGLNAGVAALNMTASVWCDLKIKIALLAAETKKA